MDTQRNKCPHCGKWYEVSIMRLGAPDTADDVNCPSCGKVMFTAPKTLLYGVPVAVKDATTTKAQRRVASELC
jgi:predicted Zn finger-like uncharacterized protein